VEELREYVGASTSLEETATSLEAFLSRRLSRSPSSEPSRKLSYAMAALGRDGRSVRLRDVSRALGMSERHLRRRFEVVVGINPKTFARIQRFRKTLTTIERV